MHAQVKGRDRRVVMTEGEYMDMLVDEINSMGGKATIEHKDKGWILSWAGFNEEEWVTFYGMWFQAEFRKRLGYSPTDDSLDYALETYAKVSHRPHSSLCSYTNLMEIVN